MRFLETYLSLKSTRVVTLSSKQSIKYMKLFILLLFIDMYSYSSYLYFTIANNSVDKLNH